MSEVVPGKPDDARSGFGTVGNGPDTHRANQMRSILAPLAVIAAKVGCGTATLRAPGP